MLAEPQLGVPGSLREPQGVSWSYWQWQIVQGCSSGRSSESRTASNVDVVQPEQQKLCRATWWVNIWAEGGAFKSDWFILVIVSARCYYPEILAEKHFDSRNFQRETVQKLHQIPGFSVFSVLPQRTRRNFLLLTGLRHNMWFCSDQPTNPRTRTRTKQCNSVFSPWQIQRFL